MCFFFSFFSFASYFCPHTGQYRIFRCFPFHNTPAKAPKRPGGIKLTNTILSGIQQRPRHWKLRHESSSGQPLNPITKSRKLLKSYLAEGKNRSLTTKYLKTFNPK